MGSGGGSASGKTDFPEYMKNYHHDMLNKSETDFFVISVVDAFNAAASGNSPYFNYISNQMTAEKMFFATGKAISDAAYAKPFDILAALANFNFVNSVSDKQVLASTDDYIADLIAAQTTTMDDEIEIGIGPKMHANARDIGMVMSSAYAISEVLIQDSKLKALAKTRLEVEALAIQRMDLALRFTISESQFKQLVVTTTADLTKYYHAIKAEVDDTNAEFIAKDLLWDLKLFQYASNPLGAINGSALSTDSGKGSKAASAVAGTMGGAAMGAYVGAQMGSGGGPWGAVIGGVVGLAYGLLS